MQNEAVAARLASLTPGEEIRHEALACIPLFGPSLDAIDYALFAELKDDSVVVMEKDGGVVSTLRVRNRSDRRVLLLEGQELRGAMQNRALMTDVLVPAHSDIDAPVNCIERGRWRPVSEKFEKGGGSSVWMRQRRAARVTATVMRCGVYDADQRQTWDDVDRVLDTAGVRSKTHALADAMRSHADGLESVRDSLLQRFPKQAVGVVTLIAGVVISVEVFDKARTLASALPDLIDGAAIDWLRGRRPATLGGRAPIGGAYFARIQQRLVDDRWTTRPSPGEGQDWRLARRSLTAVSLQLADTPVHVQVYPRDRSEHAPRA